MIEVALQLEVEEYLGRHRGSAMRPATRGRAQWTARPRAVTTGVGPIPVAAPRVNDRRLVEGSAAVHERDPAAVPASLARLAGSCPCCTCTGCPRGTSGRPAGPARAGGRRARAQHHHPTDQELDGRVRRLSAPGPRGPGLRLPLGRRHPLHDPLEDEAVVRARTDRVRPDGRGSGRPGRRLSESAESWRAVLRDLKRRGMRAPVLAIGDGALGFWAAVREVCRRPPSSGVGAPDRQVLDKLPSAPTRAKQALHAMLYAETRTACEREIRRFTAEYGAKYPKAVAALTTTRRGS